MTPADALEMAMSALLEQGIDRTEPTYDQLLALYGDNPGIADAAGLPTEAQAVAAHRRRYPHARKTSLAKTAKRARRERQSFLRSLQRYKRDERHPSDRKGGLARLLERLADRADYGTLTTLEQVAEQMRSDGVNVLIDGRLEIGVSSDRRWRRTVPIVWIAPYDLPATFSISVAGDDWREAAQVFFRAWAIAYGIGEGAEMWELDSLELVIGPPISGAYQRSASAA